MPLLGDGEDIGCSGRELKTRFRAAPLRNQGDAASVRVSFPDIAFKLPRFRLADAERLASVSKRHVTSAALVVSLLVVAAWAGARPAPTRIAFSGSLVDLQGIRVIDADGSGLRALTPPSAYPDQGPDWSPDGKWIVFTRAREVVPPPGKSAPVQTGLFRIPADGGVPRLLFWEPATAGFVTNAQWSPTGQEIAFESQRTGRPEIWIYSLSGGIRRLTRNGGTHPSWSPDGQRIAFSGPASAAYGRVEIIDRDGTGEQSVPKSANTAYPLWSPDGKWIAVRGGNAEAVARAGRPPSAEIDTLEIISVDGTIRRRLFRGGLVIPSDWSPDSKRILFWHVARPGSPTGTLFTIRRTGGAILRVPGLARAGAIASWHR